MAPAAVPGAFYFRKVLSGALGEAGLSHTAGAFLGHQLGGFFIHVRGAGDAPVIRLSSRYSRTAMGCCPTSAMPAGMPSRMLEGWRRKTYPGSTLGRCGAIGASAAIGWQALCGINMRSGRRNLPTQVHSMPLGLITHRRRPVQSSEPVSRCGSDAVAQPAISLRAGAARTRRDHPLKSSSLQNCCPAAQNERED